MTQQILGKCLKMDVIKTQQISAKPIKKVIVHPLVLLSIVDNYNRVTKDTRKRVVGVLLGSSFKGSVCYQQLRSVDRKGSETAVSIEREVKRPASVAVLQEVR
ncbi:hypothetical protein LWI29_031743 [Acer saccharum]|uniref:JAB1/MPN/MOV34 metalloenzyme domain-containing protein n=1 Tax=Acer saccharum TaxID=4024 RepID=A0AA39VMH3_ACESA|nr:hypothetical protein LWI29_031743 [Acer saccharum]